MTHIEAVFRKLDTNCDGQIDEAEFASLLRIVGEMAEAEEANALATASSDPLLPASGVTNAPLAPVRSTMSATLVSNVTVNPVRGKHGVASGIEHPPIAKDLHRWQIVYCGGATAVVDTLRGIQRTFNIALQVENFDW
jgi:hypothetical protein